MIVSESITNLDLNIASCQESLSLHHRSQSEYIASVHYLAVARFSRHRLSHQKEDLDKSILHLTEAIFLPVQAKPFLNVVRALFYLAIALLERSGQFKQPDDINYALGYLRYIRRFPPDSFDVPRTNLTTRLIWALCAPVKLGTGNGTEDIKEMVVLCNELLFSGKSEDIPANAFIYLDRAVQSTQSHQFTTEMLDEIIDCFRNAVKVCPLAPSESYKVMYALADALGKRFIRKHSIGDYEEATTVLERILEPGGCPDSFRVMPSSLAIMLAHARWIFFPKQEYAEIAMTRLREFEFDSPFLPEQRRLQMISCLVSLNKLRFKEYGLEENLEKANSYVSQLVNASSSSSLAESPEFFPRLQGLGKTYSADIQLKIERLEKLLLITPSGTRRYIACLGHLEDWYESKFRHTNDISDLEMAIKYSRLLLDADRDDGPGRIGCLCSRRNILLLAFQKTRKINYLDESIAVCYDILESKTMIQQTRFVTTRMLMSSLIDRWELLGQIKDIHEAVRLIPSVINDQYAQDSDRFHLSCQWAILARSIGHPITLTAYKTAMSLIQKSFSLAPTVSVQHARLVAMGQDCQTMPLDYASYQIHLGRFEEAVETLEQGRALLWSEMRALRTPVFQVIEEEPLAKRFAEINRELETLTITVTPSGSSEVEDGIHQRKDGTDPFGRLLIKRKNLIEERDALIAQTQSRPGLEGFLWMPSFDTLRSVASRGPVVIINHCKWRSDIIIIFHNSLPCSIPTAKTFYADANKLQDKLVKARNSEGGLNSKKYQDALCSVLKGLYELVGQPVIKRLRLLGVPEQSRIWWCPTSVFCSLPLHAMGPIPSSDPGVPQYFSDLYIPSYTPSLSALIDSRKANPRILRKPSLLLVAQPGHDLPGVDEEIEVIRKFRRQVSVTYLVSGEATPTSVIEGLRGNSLAHFACHGLLETGKPFDASFKLHEGERLTLLKIVQSRLPDAEFAFLSCCHAAEITEESIFDEALHLTAAMQYCGFRSVVGTMWAMADTDGRDLAKNFYKSLFSSQESGVPYYERSAEALRDATQKLRRKRVNLERWVNFVHYGA